jgi:hypothetical protein
LGYVKKPECLTRRSGDEWLRGFDGEQAPNFGGFFHRRNPVGKHGILNSPSVMSKPGHHVIV